MPNKAIFTPRHRSVAAALLGLIATFALGSAAASAQDDRSPWLGRWVIAAETCQNNGYDMLIEQDHFEIWEQACDIKNWKIASEVATLTMQCFNEGDATTKESLKLMVRGDTIERVGGYDFSPNTMVRCR